MGYLSSKVVAHNGVFSKPFKNSSNLDMKNIRCPNNLKFIREYRGMSQEALSELVGTVKGQIYKLETGERKLTHAWMVRLANPLKCNPSDFVIDKNKLFLDQYDDGLRDSEIAIIDAIKDLIQILCLTNPDISGMLRNAFSYQRAEYKDGGLKNAVQVMEILGRFVGEPSSGAEQTLIRRLLQIAPLGSA